MLPDTIPAPVLGVCEPPAPLAAALAWSRAEYYRALDLPINSYAEQAVRAEALGAACAQAAAAWAALARWVFTPGPGPRPHWVFASAVLGSRRREEDAARFWRDTAGYWARAAAGADPRDLDAEDLDLHDGRGRWAS
jgi:hypothetical protein